MLVQSSDLRYKPKMSSSNVTIYLDDLWNYQCADKGLLLPLFSEYTWPHAVRAALYLLGMLWYVYVTSTLRFYAPKQNASRVFAIVWSSVCLSVCPSVCHTRELYQNGASLDHEIFTAGCPKVSSLSLIHI